MRSAWEKGGLVGAVLILIGGAPALAEPGDHQISSSIERATGATVGILEKAQDAAGPTEGPRFSVRGTGVHIRDGYIVTARHAVEREEGGKPVIPQEISVLTISLDELTARLTGVNAFLDIAVYQIKDNGAAVLPAVAFADSEPVAGEEVFTVGYPLGWGPTVGFGRIGNTKTFLPTVETRLVQADISACSGNSGGGLFNARGEIVGIVHAIIQTEPLQAERRCSRFTFAVPGPVVQRIATQLLQGKQPEFARLGAQLKAVKVGTRWRVAVKDAIGPALDGGVRKGDLLLAIEDTPITSAAQLKTYLMERTVPGQQVRLQVQRGTTMQVLVVTLGRS